MTTTLDYTDSIYQTSINDFYNGVLKVSTGTKYGTGSLLYDGRSILTAAHLFNGIDYTNKRIYIYDGVNEQTLYAKVTIYDGYDDINLNGDLAMVTFTSTLDESYNRYDIYRQNDALNNDFIAIGYGDVGTGDLGYLNIDDIYKLKTTNTFDADLYDLEQIIDASLTWNPLNDSILVADFDSGEYSNDAIGFYTSYDLGTGITEGIIAPGDSGGPAFIDNSIAGIASYSFNIDSNIAEFDITTYDIDSTFGEIGAWQSTYYYQEWIDKTIRENFINAPTSRDEVQKEVSENDTYTYFMVEFLPLRDSVNGIVSVDYKTVDGTAIAGLDYIATYGTLNIYQDEQFALIPVEIIDDNLYEYDEFFYLEISNPNNGSFGENILTLTAVRTIVDDESI